MGAKWHPHKIELALHKHNLVPIRQSRPLVLAKLDCKMQFGFSNRLGPQDANTPRLDPPFQCRRRLGEKRSSPAGQVYPVIRHQTGPQPDELQRQR